MTSRPRSAAGRLALGVAIAAVYLLVARLSMGLAGPGGVATIWPGAGIAVAVFLRLGFRYWPAIAVAALLEPLTSGFPVFTSMGGALANTAGPAAGVWLLRRAIGQRDIFWGRIEMFRFIGWACVVGSAIAATLGLVSLWAGGVAAAGALPDLWWSWWLSDLAGTLVVAPALLTIGELAAVPRDRRRLVEALLLALGLLAASWLVFGVGRIGPLAFTPLAVWAVFAFGPVGAAYSALVVTGVGFLGAARGAAALSGVLEFQTFVAAIGGTNLVLAAVIVERKRARRQIAAHNLTLEERVVEQTQDLRKQNAALEEAILRYRKRSAQLEEAQESLLRQERLATLGELAGSVAHEVRNPLAVIHNSVYFLERSGDVPPEKVTRHLAMVRRSVRRVEDIITELLDFAREPAASAERFALETAVEGALAEVEMGEDIELRRRCDDSTLLVEADSAQVQAILSNLVRNAVEAMPRGGSLTVACYRRGAEAVVTVRDSGPGIDEKDLEKVFEPLFTGKASGIGLGLTVSRRYAHLNGGRLECESEAGRGALFRLVLPAAEPGAAELVSSSAAAPA